MNQRTAAVGLATAIAILTASATAAPFVEPANWTVSKPSEVKTGGTFRFGRFGDDSTLNPFYTRNSGDVVQNIAAGYLFTRDPVTKEWIPYLAENYTLSADKRTFTINLRKGAKWSDGKPVVADDFIVTAKINQDEKFETVNADSYYIDGKPVVLTKIDNDSFKVTFPSVIGTAFYQLAILDVQPAHIFGPAYAKGPAALKAMWPLSAKADDIVSTGPFKFQAYRPGERVTYVKNPYYGEWNKDSAGHALPYLDGMVESIYRDANAQFAAFLAGQLDTITPRGADDLAGITAAVKNGSLKAVIKANASSAASGDRISFNFNRKSDPWKQALFRNVDFRRAMSHLANRSAMVQIALGGFGTPIYSMVYPVLKQFQSPNLKKYDFDPEAAAALLKKIGFTKKNAAGYLVDKSGHQLEFDLSPNAGNARRAAEAQIFADEAKKVGVKVNVRPVDSGTWADLLDSRGDDRKFDAILWGSVGGDEDLPYSPYNVGCEGNGLAHNMSGKCIFPWESQMQALLNRAMREMDDAKRKQIIFQIQDLETANVEAINLISQNQHFAWAERVEGEFQPAQQTSLAASPTWGPRSIDLTWLRQQ